MKVLAREIYDQHFKAAQAHPRGVVAKLCGIVKQLESACGKHVVQAEGSEEWSQEMSLALEELTALLKDEHTISAYELHSSGLVQTLLNCLNNVSILWLFYVASPNLLTLDTWTRPYTTLYTKKEKEITTNFLISRLPMDRISGITAFWTPDILRFPLMYDSF